MYSGLLKLLFMLEQSCSINLYMQKKVSIVVKLFVVNAVARLTNRPPLKFEHSGVRAGVTELHAYFPELTECNWVISYSY